ncbi:carboxypeptidase-like regulatory domain-containing protein [Polluticoccus soli]|uniref:carboxypeptidase-like regulatory domain-containing protein n=1 Tax=Polluticoccus soli TaxID=3034150 RepID=UPI0023E34064|nr:carboxypeptidase-like regulatory domain-containing protein [Flavipsychrobacter sp. JY13-12]
MRPYISLIGSLLLWLMHSFAYGQAIQGQIVDAGDNKPLDDVAILNLHTNAGVASDDQGKFTLAATRGHLIEFRKTGYKIIRIRLPQGTLPAFFKVVMEKASIQLAAVEIAGVARDYKSDSIRYYQLYKEALEFPELTGMQAISHPFSALSKKNQQIWAFQKHYAWYQQQKYIDFTFNEKLVTNITGMRGDSVQAYLQLFRPTYEQLRSMNEYAYYTFIKRTVAAYRERGPRARLGIPRGTR